MSQNKPKEPLKIALTGRMGSGKDAVGDILYKKHRFYEFAFGDALKKCAHEIFRDVPENPKPRELYQFMNVMREYDPDVWIKHVARKVEIYEELFGTTQGFVITDVRAQNEFDWAKTNGFKVVRVSVPDDIQAKRLAERDGGFDPKHLAHETEQLADTFDVDFEIVNDGSIDDLKARVGEMVRYFTEEAVN